MTENEVLEKLGFFKQAIQKLKEELGYWEEQSIENPKEVCELEGWKEAWRELNEERLKDAETIAELEKKCNELKAKLENVDSENSDKKYTEEDLKKLLHKASETSKKKINELTTQNKNWEEEYYKLKEKHDNLEITNRSLDRELQEKHAAEEIDKVLEGEITEKEFDEIFTKPAKTIKLDL